MGSVVAFRKPDEPEHPHQTGEAVCVGCNHRWVAVAPIGTPWLHCPECGSERGTWRYAIGGIAGDLQYACICGGEALTAYKRDGHFWLRCMGCGLDQTRGIFGDAP